MKIDMTPLDCWAAKKIGMEQGPVKRELLNRYQQSRLSETIRLAAVNSSFYRRRLGKWADWGVNSLADIAPLPFTTQEELREHGQELLCVSQSQINRVVTLNTSGTSGEPKRLWFTSEDQALTVDFFRAGMSTLVGSGDKVMILLPGERPGSVGDLLAQALISIGVTAIPRGPVQSLDDTLRMMCEEKVDSVVGIPVHVLALARYSLQCTQPSMKLKSVLLSTDYAAYSLIREVEQVWDCKVFDHYGMTEMGLGGGVECEAHAGFHLREAELYFEIIDPDTGDLLPDGSEGEVVFSTLTRRGMPLIRYRTGDLSRILPEPCACGSVLKRLDRIGGRRDFTLQIPDGAEVRLTMMDEALFAVSGVIDYRMDVDDSQERVKIALTLLTVGAKADVETAVFKKLSTNSPIAAAWRSGQVELTIQAAVCDGTLVSTPMKRAIRKAMGCYGKL